MVTNCFDNPKIMLPSYTAIENMITIGMCFNSDFFYEKDTYVLKIDVLKLSHLFPKIVFY